ncbi:MAG: bifunctional folylpolyglutamate synthase/dihydrofolate synthase [Oscillospiraceae bacterium]|nr:bifunctional folylpolyglutamate synthase/dihydrofolate synthase [Oscillospiraceae bacterium]
MNIYDVMKYIDGFSKSGEPVKNLYRFKRVMSALSNPQERLKLVHVAGTNGKGSTARMVANALALAGYKTGEFTSPYIRAYNERIRINGVNISDMELCEIVSQIAPLLEGVTDGCSQFEITTAIALVYFAAKNCEAVVLETGVGGLLDCTNIINTTLVSVITSISYDHTAVLGNSLEAIAFQKAGIIKPGRPVVLSPNQSKEAVSVVRAAANAKNSLLIIPNTERLTVEKCDCEGNRFIYKNALYVTSMLGKHQIENAMTAIETIRILRKIGFPKLSFIHAYEGIKTAKPLSRCQILRADEPFIMIDGAHNPGGMRALADFIREIPKAPKIMICGISNDKDWKTAIGYISRYIDFAVCVDGFAPQTVFAPTLAELFVSAEACPLRKAVPKAIDLAGAHGMVVIAGSLYLASALMKQMG